MAQFRFRAFNPRGQAEQGLIEAHSTAEAIDQLISRGLTPYETVETAQQASQAPWRQRLAYKNGASLALYADFARQMATLLGADLPVDHALRFIATTTSSPSAILAKAVHEAVIAGSALSSAFQNLAPDAPPYIKNLIAAGEHRGNLATTFADLAGLLEGRLAQAEKVKSALLYPAILAVAALAAVGVVVSVLVPALLPLFDDAKAPPPAILAGLHTIAGFVSAYWAEVLIVLLLAVLGFGAVRRSQRGRAALDALWLRVPFFGSLLRKSQTALFAHTLGTLLRSGVSVVSALEMSKSVLTNGVLVAAADTARSKVEEGQRLSQALSSSQAFPQVAVELISVGDEAGKLDVTLSRTAKILDDETQKSVDRGLSYLGPALTVAVGLGVGGLILSVMDAMLSVNELVLK